MRFAEVARWRPLLACLCGIVVSLLAYILFLTEGWAYLHDDPYACANCHLMEEPVSSWVASSHHATALCNDCHAPWTIAARQIQQAINGVKHGWSFTFSAGRVVPRLGDVNSRILAANCTRCHAGLLTELVPGGAAHSMDGCTRCHRTVGHG